MRTGFGGLAKEVRGASNSIGIRVKKRPSMSADSFYNDDEYEIQKSKIDADINSLLQRCVGYDNVVFPQNPIGSGLAKLNEKSPRTFKYLMKRLKGIGVST